MGECTAFAKFRDARRVFADERFGEADDIDDGDAVHGVMTLKRSNCSIGIPPPLTLTLSRGERGQLSRLPFISSDPSTNPAFDFSKNLETNLPLRWGEGRGEGKVGFILQRE